MYGIDPRLLRKDQAEALCERCNTVFDALAFLSVKADGTEVGAVRLLNPSVLVDPATTLLSGIGRQRMEELDAAARPESPDPLAADQPFRRRFRPSSDTLRWGGGALALLILLLIQVYSFEGKRLAQIPQVRPALENLCAVFGCTLSPFRDPDRLQILDRTLNMAANAKSGFEFSLVFANQADLPQAFPKLKLVLDELDGKPVAERVFEPIEYLADWQEGALMPVGKLFEVRLAIAKPSREVGGFTIEFR